MRLVSVARLLGILGLAALAWGQESRAVISGTVTDPQGAVVPAAEVEVKNLETNVVTKVATNSSGFYTVPPVNPGLYSITASATGFKTVVRSKVELRLADRVGLDFKLELGTASETVTVTGETPLVDTQTATTGTLINNELVQTLPTFGRDVSYLAQFTAGIFYTNVAGKASVSERPFDEGDNNFSINGGAASTNEMLLDGAPNTGRESGSPTNQTIMPPPEAVSEMSILTNLYDASYGRTGGGVISTSLRSGTNDFHGAAWWYAHRTNGIRQAPCWRVRSVFRRSTTAGTRRFSCIPSRYFETTDHRRPPRSSPPTFRRRATSPRRTLPERAGLSWGSTTH